MRRLRLRYLSGPRRGDELIFSGPRVRIGRSRDNSLILTESEAPASSGRHAEAAFEGGAWFIVDSGSTNGTFVNGSRVQRQKLGAGDTLAFGDDRFLVADSGRRLWLIAAALIAIVGGAAYSTRRHAPLSAEQIAASAARSTYAVVLESGGRRSIVGTAFAVDADLLATNAHVASALRDRIGAGEALAVHGDTFQVTRISAVTLHPDWKPGSIRADAAVLHLDSRMEAVRLMLADGAAFERLQRGTNLVSFGFPGVSTDPQRPRGRLARDIVGDVRGEYVQTGLAITPGTSGSPVFDDQGAVVAMVAGGDFVKGPDGTLMPSGSQANWAISIERVRELLRTK